MKVDSGHWSALVFSCLYLACQSQAAPLLGEPLQQGHSSPVVRRAPDDLTGEEAATVRLFGEVLPAVVTIRTLTSPAGASGTVAQQGLGTGILIGPECHVLTAAHVVDGAASIAVRTQDGQNRPAELLFSEPGADIALLQLEDPDLSLPHARLGDSDRLAVGQNVYVIGNPRGLEDTFTAGHISGFREFNRLYDGTILVEFVQTDAAINSGNSGGPVFDSKGRVIGIASRIVTESGGSDGLGFAVTINSAKKLLALERRQWMGFRAVFLSHSELARLFNVDREGGLLVQYVVKNSPADKAGLRAGYVAARIGGRKLLLGGDLIVEFGGQKACHGACLAAAHERIEKLDRVSVSYLRDGAEGTVTIDVSSSRRKFLRAAAPVR